MCLSKYAALVGAATVCVSSALAQPAATDLGTLSAGTPVDVNTIAVAPATVTWYRFTVPAVSNPLYLDIDTEGTTLVTSNDTEIGLYDSTGALIASDDDSGSGFLSELSFGAAFPSRPPATGGTAFAGQNGSLAAGTYYLALGGFNVTFGSAAWNATSTSTYTGNAQLHLRLASVPPPPPGTYVESGDAGETVATAQAVTGGSGNVAAIQGVIGTDDADLYLIQICDHANFSATTDQGTTLDTQLFLFTQDGHGVSFNDDISDTGTINRQSRVTGANVPADGTYLLGITVYNRDPVDASGALIWNNTPFAGERAPDGPGAANPLDHWTGSTGGGTYMITLTGVCYPGGGGGCPVDVDHNGQVQPADVAAFVSLWFASLTNGDLNGDFDHNGQVQPADVASFVAAWFAALQAGHCP